MKKEKLVCLIGADISLMRTNSFLEPNNRLKIKAIVFDFDNVIVRGSEKIKKDAWSDIFKKDTEKITLKRALKEFGHGMGDRADIIRFVISEVGFKNKKKLVEQYVQLYGKIVSDQILEKGIHKDDLDAIDVLSKEYSLFVNSATPEKELIKLCNSLGIYHFFNGIYGRPNNKVENLTRVAESVKCKSFELVFVGDGRGDMLAAQNFGCFFIGVDSLNSSWSDKPEILVGNLRQVFDFLSQKG